MGQEKWGEKRRARKEGRVKWGAKSGGEESGARILRKVGAEESGTRKVG